MEAFLKRYEEWVRKSGVASAKNYATRLKRVIGEWNQHSVSGLVPFEKKVLPVIFSSKGSEEIINNVVFRLRKFNENAFFRNEYTEGYHNDIVTAINRFRDFVIAYLEKDIESLDFKKFENSTCEEINISEGVENLKNDKAFFQDFDIQVLLDAVINRTRTRESSFWPARKFSGVLPEKGKWIDPFVNSLIVMTECGIHKLREVVSFRIQDDILYVKPHIYIDNPQRDKSKAKDLAHLTADGYVKAYSYHADGSIHPFKVSYDASGSPIPSISFEHTPAISLIVSKGNYPEISNLIADKKPDANKLQEEMGDVLKRMTCVLMQKDQNVRKKDAW